MCLEMHQIKSRGFRLKPMDIKNNVTSSTIINQCKTKESFKPNRKSLKFQFLQWLHLLPTLFIKHFWRLHPPRCGEPAPCQYTPTSGQGPGFRSERWCQRKRRLFGAFCPILHLVWILDLLTIHLLCTWLILCSCSVVCVCVWVCAPSCPTGPMK